MIFEAHFMKASIKNKHMTCQKGVNDIKCGKLRYKTIMLPPSVLSSSASD